MAKLSRWHRAQEYERRYWETFAADIEDWPPERVDWYRWSAQKLAERLRAVGLGHLTEGQVRVLEVGAGPLGIVSCLPARERVAVDPLEEFYASNAALAALRSSDVKYLKGVGEDLPCEDSRYDLAIIANCIDHVDDVRAVSLELSRALRAGGILYLTVNSRVAWGFWMHRILSALRIDAGHPHTFTPARVERLLRGTGFEIVGIEVGSFFTSWWRDLRSRQPKRLAQALLGVSHFPVVAIARKPGGS